MARQETRRDFLKTMATGAIVLGAASGLAGCAPHGKGKASASNGGWDKEYDVVIVGAGIAGLSAAITVAREGNGESCLLVEKEAQAAGCSPVCAGDFLGRDAEHEYPLQYLKDLAATPIGPSIPDDVLEAFRDGIDENLQWVLDLGATTDMFDTSRGVYDDRSKAEYRELDSWASAEYSFDDNARPPFNHVFNFLDHIRTSEYGDQIDYRPSTPLEDLVQDDQGRVTGVVAKGKRFRAKKGVIMCCGGYEHNAEMLEGYCGCGSAISFCGPGNTGDGIAIAQRAGADFWHMHNAAGFWMAPRNLDNTAFSNGALTSHNFKKYGITVAKNGRRFYMDWDGHKSLDYADDKISSDLSMHVGSRHGVMQFGGEWSHLPMPSVGWFVFDADALKAGAFDYKTSGSSDPVADGWLYEADTIEGLASQMSVPADQLVKTVETWNKFCDGGEDLAFFRPSDTLTPIHTAPFYAQRCAPAMLNTDGGPKRSAKGEVLDHDGNPIPGLYSAGEFGSVWGHLYQGDGNVGEAMAFGRIAARNCMA